MMKSTIMKRHWHVHYHSRLQGRALAVLAYFAPEKVAEPYDFGHEKAEPYDFEAESRAV